MIERAELVPNLGFGMVIALTGIPWDRSYSESNARGGGTMNTEGASWSAPAIQEPVAWRLPRVFAPR